MATVITLFPYKSINIKGTYQYFKAHTLGDTQSTLSWYIASKSSCRFGPLKTPLIENDTWKKSLELEYFSVFNTLIPDPSEQFKNCFAGIIYIVDCGSYYLRLLCTFRLFLWYITPFLLGTPISTPGPGEHSVTVPFPPGHMGTSSKPYPQASGDSGWSKGWAHASSRIYGQPFSHSQEERQHGKRAHAQREQRLKTQRNSPASGANGALLNSISL